MVSAGSAARRSAADQPVSEDEPMTDKLALAAAAVLSFASISMPAVAAAESQVRTCTPNYGVGVRPNWLTSPRTVIVTIYRLDARCRWTGIYSYVDRADANRHHTFHWIAPASLLSQALAYIVEWAERRIGG
jgi:hypothetical protein